ncbi:helix-turn-helix domain-containing protein, partial [Pseudorhodobacter sp.]|uniref:helix-turn-helix domain-containing protein n=1 Tax=Pseudorhodobacter sp. TaxID=1934400 RepID=UPI0026497084
MSAQPLQNENITSDYPTLPDDMQRYHLQELLRDIGPMIGLSDARRHILEVMIGMTAPKDWIDPTRDAICYAAQTLVAEKAHRTTKAIRSAETAFVAAGLIVKTVADNGHRGIYAKGAVIHGLSFAPLIERVKELLAIKHAQDAARLQRAALRRQCSAARRVLRLALMELLKTAPIDPITT